MDENGRQYAHVVEALKALEPGLLPLEIFYQVARLAVLPAVEVVPLRVGDGMVEVFLTQRPSNDPFWPGEWHNPGTIVRPTDESGSFSVAFKRVCDGELGLHTWDEPVFVNPWLWHCTRGSALSLIHWLDVSHLDIQVPGQYFPVNALPHNIIAGMETVVSLAVDHYKQTKGII